MSNERFSLSDRKVIQIADFFKVFGDPTRIKILYTLLDKKELTVSELAEHVDISPSAISHQLRILRQNYLVKYIRDGRNVYYSLDDAHVSTLLDVARGHLDHVQNENT